MKGSPSEYRKIPGLDSVDPLVQYQKFLKGYYKPLVNLPVVWALMFRCCTEDINTQLIQELIDSSANTLIDISS